MGGKPGLAKCKPSTVFFEKRKDMMNTGLCCNRHGFFGFESATKKLLASMAPGGGRRGRGHQGHASEAQKQRTAAAGGKKSLRQTHQTDKGSLSVPEQNKNIGKQGRQARNTLGGFASSPLWVLGLRQPTPSNMSQESTISSPKPPGFGHDLPVRLHVRWCGYRVAVYPINLWG